jgi:type 1 fimbria pilin
MGNQDKDKSLNQIICDMLDSTKEVVPKLFDQILVPSFSINQSNCEYEAKGVIASMHLESARQSASIELISGLSANLGIKLNDSSQVQKVDGDFIFALNDQNLLKNNLKNPLILAAEVNKSHWIKV